MVSPEIKTFVYEDWLSGLSYRELSTKYDISLGSLSTLIGEHKAKVPDLELLRNFKLRLESQGLNIHDLMRGMEITAKLEELGIGAATVKTFVEMAADSTPEAWTSVEFVTHLTRLRTLQEQTGLRPAEILIFLEESGKQLGEQKRELVGINIEIQNLKNLKEASKFLDWMKDCRISYPDLIDHSISLEDLGEERKKAVEKLQDLKRQIAIEKKSLKMVNKILRSVLCRTLSPQPQAYWP